MLPAPEGLGARPAEARFQHPGGPATRRGVAVPKLAATAAPAWPESFRGSSATVLWMWSRVNLSRPAPDLDPGPWFRVPCTLPCTAWCGGRAVGESCRPSAAGCFLTPTAGGSPVSTRHLPPGLGTRRPLGFPGRLP